MYLIKSGRTASVRHFYLMLMIVLPIISISGPASIVIGLVTKTWIALGLGVLITVFAVGIWAWMILSND